VKLATDCVQVGQGDVLTELKGAARTYWLAQPQSQVWRYNRVGMWHLVQVTADPQARGCSFKQFLTDGPHLGWVRADAQGELTFLRKDFTPLPASHPGAAPAGPKKAYGDELLVYGSGHCARCNAVHEAHYHLKESRRSRFRLLQFVAEMSSFAVVGNGPKPWTEMASETGDPVKPLKLAALRSMRGGIPLVDVTTARYGGAEIRSDVVKLLRRRPGLTSKEMMEELEPEESYINTGAKTGPDGKKPLVVKGLAEGKFENVLAALLTSGNIAHDGGKPKRYQVIERLRPTGVTAVTAETTGEFMVGILICPERTYVAASGPGLDNPKFRAIAARKGYSVCKARTVDTVPRTTTRGEPISRELYVGAKDPTAPDPGNCAAPRLIQQATEDGSIDKLKRKEWEMSEIYYLPSTAKRTSEQNNGLYWLHGLTAHSCQTCEKLVPILLCPALL
jgi:hypothetical protein